MIPLLRFSGVQCKRALHYTSLFKERQIKQTNPAWTRGLRPRGVGDADAQGAMRQLRGVGPRCRPKGCVAYARGRKRCSSFFVFFLHFLIFLTTFGTLKKKANFKTMGQELRT